MVLQGKKRFSQKSRADSLRPHSPELSYTPTTEPAPDGEVGSLQLIGTNCEPPISLGAHHPLSTLPKLIPEQNATHSPGKEKMAAVQTDRSLKAKTQQPLTE